MDVVPVVIDADVLGLHVGFVGDGGGGERFVGGGVLAHAIEDVAGHVHHVAGGRARGGREFRRCAALARAWAGFDGVNPVVICGGVFGLFFQNGLQNRETFDRAFFWFAVVVVAIQKCPTQKHLRVRVVRRALDEFAENFDFGGVFVVAGLLFGSRAVSSPASAASM